MRDKAACVGTGSGMAYVLDAVGVGTVVGVVPYVEAGILLDIGVAPYVDVGMLL